MNLMKKVLFGLLAIFILLQLFRGTPPEVRKDNPDDIALQEELSPEVATLLKSACYDCHSMESVYPWYSYITPVSWFLFDHVEDGRSELNFSEWGTMTAKRKLHKLKELSEEVEEGEMPLKSYTPIHPEARLTSAQRNQIIAWASELSHSIENRRDLVTE